MDLIKFSLPAKAEYLLAVRLTASAIGTRKDFNLDAIESLKSAVSESCLIIMSSMGCETLDINFEVRDFTLKVNITGVGVGGEKPENADIEIATYMLQAMAEDVQYVKDEDSTITAISFIATEE